jgi:hypothetical protein
LLQAGVLAAALSLSGTGFASDDQARAGARAAASAGADAADAGRWQESLDYFRRAEALVHSPVHLWYMARAHRELGQLVAAREACLKVQREGLPAQASSGIKAAHEGCEEVLRQLEGRIPTLTLRIAGVPQGLAVQVTRDGEELPSALVGIPAPVDPGEHTFVARAEGYLPEEGRVTLQEGAEEVLTLTLRADPNAAASPPASTEQPVTATPSDSGSGWGAPPLASTIAFGVGVVGVAAGTVFALRSSSQADDADQLCGGTRSSCSLDPGSSEAQRVLDLNDQAGTSRTLAIVGFGVGGAAIATGLVLWILDSGSDAGAEPKTANAPTRRWTPLVGLDRVGFQGVF